MRFYDKSTYRYVDWSIEDLVSEALNDEPTTEMKINQLAKMLASTIEAANIDTEKILEITQLTWRFEAPLHE